MGRIYQSVGELIGHTPLLQLNHMSQELGLKGNVLAKLECFNPAGSIKDRVAKAMLDAAIDSGKINKDSVIIEPTSGNTGIGLAAAAAAYGMKSIIIMPETMSVERRMLVKAFGAELILTEGSKGMKGAIEKAEELLKEIPNSMIAGQFSNPVNPQTHYDTTGPEIYEDTDGKVDYLVAGVGTGGTITGTGRYLKEKIKGIKVIAVEPTDSPFLSQGKAGAHKLQGIGAGFVPEILDTTIYDEIITVSSEDAFETGRLLGQKEGILVGVSSGAALWAAISAPPTPTTAVPSSTARIPTSGCICMPAALWAAQRPVAALPM